MGSEVIIALVGLFCTTVSSIVTFILTKRKYNTEVEAQYITNVKEAFDAYKNTVTETIDEQNKKIESLKKENAELRQQLSTLQSQMMNLLIGEKLKENNQQEG